MSNKGKATGDKFSKQVKEDNLPVVTTEVVSPGPTEAEKASAEFWEKYDKPKKDKVSPEQLAENLGLDKPSSGPIVPANPGSPGSWHDLSEDDKDVVGPTPKRDWQKNSGKSWITEVSSSVGIVHNHFMKEIVLSKGEGWRIFASAKHNFISKADVRIYLDKYYIGEEILISSQKQAHILPQSATEIIFIPWQDMSIPRMSQVQRVVDYVVSMIKKGKDVEVGCFGGHGRTGTFIACVIVSLLRMPAKDAISFVRKNYCSNAIETKDQEKFVEDFQKEF